MMRIAAILIAILALCINGFSQSVAVTAYDETAGLAKADVRVIHEDQHGMIWVGTKGAGLYRFNHGAMQQATVELSTYGFEIEDISEDRAGNIYVLSSTGLHRYNGSVTGLISLAEPSVHGIEICADSLWQAGTDGLYYGSQNTQILRQGVRCMTCTDRDELLVVTGDSLNIIVSDSVLSYPLPTHDWTVVAPADDNGVWIGANDGQLLHFINNQVESFETGLPILSVLPATGRQVWLGSTEGLHVFTGNDALHYAPEDGQGKLKAPVQTMVFDAYDRLWLGSATHGLLQYHGNKVQSFPNRTRQSAQQLTADESSESMTYVSTDRILHHLDLSGSEPADTALTEYGPVQLGWIDAFDRLWIATQRDLLLQLPDTLLSISEMVGNALRFYDPEIITGDGLGTIWLHTRQQLWRLGLNGSSPGISLPMWTVTYTENLPSTPVVDVLVRDNGEVIRLDHNSVGKVSFSTNGQNARYTRMVRSDYKIVSSSLDTYDRIWIGTDAGGIQYLDEDDGQIQSLVSPYALQPFAIQFVWADESGVWAATDRQLLYLALNESRDRVSEVSEVLSLPPGSFNSESIGVSSENAIVAVTASEIFRINTVAYNPGGPPPRVFIRSANIDQVPLQKSEYRQPNSAYVFRVTPPSIAFMHNSVAFELQGVSRDAAPLTYQWKLDPLHDEWSEPSTQTTVQFAALPPGQYAFDVQVCNNKGRCSQLPLAWEFEIRKALRHHWWFWTGLASILVACLWMIIRRRERRILKESKRERARLDAQLKALTLEQKALRLQMNPHFMFNAMQTIQHQITSGEHERARANLGQFARLMRATLDISRKERITLEDEIDYLEQYLAAESACSPKPFVYHVDIDPSLETFAIEIPPMLFQPVVENALKHGLGNDNPKVTVAFSEFENKLRCEVEDNGAGFSESANQAKSAALDILRRRLDQFAGGGSIQIENRTNESGDIQGASVTVLVPLGDIG